MKKTICLFIFTLGLSLGIAAQSSKSPKLPAGLITQLVIDDPAVQETMRDNKWNERQVSDAVNYARRVDLNGDEVPEFIFSGIICRRNCSTWIYQKNGRMYRRIPFEDSASNFTVLGTRTHDYLDISIEGRSNAAESEIRTYKFDGQKYDVAECFSKTYIRVRTKAGKWTTSAKVKPIQCTF